MLELKKISSLKFTLNFLGDGVLHEKLKNKTKELGIQDSIKFHGIVSNPEKYLQNSHIYVHSAFYEPFGLVILEAMSTGLPVISTDGRGNRDLINNKNGILLNHRDPKKYALEIIELINNKNKYDKLSEESIRTAKRYDIKNYTDKLLNLYFSATK